MTAWYQKTAAETAVELNTDLENGLPPEAAEARLEQYGPNELEERGAKSRWRILGEQFTEVMVVILIIAAVVSVFLNEFTNAVVILLIVILNAVLGYTQEYRAEQAIAALKQMAVPLVRVLRGGQIAEISAREIVPGDIVLLEAGNMVPADGRLLEAVNLKAQEAALTGESEAVEKNAGLVAGGELPVGDRKNMVYMGTVITYGRGRVIITETGMGTELGRIANLIQSVEREPTPLQRRLENLGKTLALAALGLILVVIGIGWVQGEAWTTLVLTAISLAVAVVPEGLPAVVTITLALGAQRMLKRESLVRKLPAVEALGSVTTICSDKTGTLTENRMTVTLLDVAGDQRSVDALLERGIPMKRLDADIDLNLAPSERTLTLLVKAMTLANDARLQTTDDGQGQRAIGDPTEGALIVAASQLGLEKETLEERWPRVAEVPFSSERKRMTTVHETLVPPSETDAPWRDDPYVAFSKGAVDSLLEVTDQVWIGDGAVPLDEDLLERINRANAEMAANGQRVLGVAFRTLDDLPEEGSSEQIEKNMIFIGLVGMLDPPRPEVREAVAKCRTAGIRPVMITGDHPLTAKHIAVELDIARPESQTITGSELAQMNSTQLEERVEDVPVYARVSPEHKLNIVTALQERGQIVAMTGDGVNDAPALKKADIGVAMGITGTDVSKEAADMVLLDDNFATIVAAVEEGRVIFDNIRKFIRYTLSSNIGELFVMLLAPFLGMPLPLVPLQILWINLVTDGLPGLALAIEKGDPGVMSRRPFKPDEGIFSRGLGRQILWVGSLMGAVSLGMGWYFWDLAGRPAVGGHDVEVHWRTMLFTTLVLAQMGNALALRSNRESIFKIGFFSNMAMVGAIVLTFVLQLGVQGIRRVLARGSE